MTQYVIDTGAVPDDGQGDPLRTAFEYTNENFNQIFEAGPVGSNVKIANNTITTTVINSNLILSPSGIGKIQVNNTLLPRINNVYDLGNPSQRFNTIYVGLGGLDVAGSLVVSGNITADYFVGNGSALTGIVATTGSRVENGNSNINIPAAGSNIFVTVNGTGNIVVFANTGAYVAGEVSATGNISGNYILGNGALLTGISANYSNANVAAYLPTYTGNLVSLTGPVTTTANVTGGNIRTSGQITATGNITGGNVDATRVNAVTVTTSGAISAGGNVTGNNLIGTTLIGTTVTATANVVGGNITTTGQISSTGNIQGGNLNVPGGTVTSLTVSAQGNIRGNNIVTPGFITATGNITGGNVDTGNIHAGNVNVDSIVSAQGNVYGNTFVGNALAVSGNVSAGNISISGAFGASTLSAAGNVTGGNLLTTGRVSASGNVSGNYFVGNGALLTGITVSAGTSLLNGNSNVVVSASGNVTVGVNGTSNIAQFSNTGAYVTGVVSATGNITGSYLLGNGALITGLPAGYSNADVANFLPTYSGNLPNLTGLVSTTGNVAGNYFIGNGSLLTGVTASGVNASALTGNTLSSNVINSSLISVGTLNDLSVTGTTNSGNLSTGGTISATGNITGNYILGNGALLTGVITSVANINLGTSNVTVVSSGGNVAVGIGGTSNVAVFATTGEYVTGVVSASGNVTGNNILTAGLITATGNVAGNNIFATGFASVVGNVIAGNVNTSVIAPTSGALTLSTASGNLNLSPAGNIVLSNTYINSVAYPVQDTDAATKLYVDNLVSTAIAYHEPVAAATTTTLAAATGGTITYAQPNGVANGVGATLTTTGSFDLIDTSNVQSLGTRILVKDQANAVQNGIYTWANATAIVRSTDADVYGVGSSTRFGINDYFFVQNGNDNAGSAFIVSAPAGTITFGTSNITFALFSQTTSYTANVNAGLSLIGTQFNAKVDQNTTAFDGSGNIIVKAGANLTTPNIGAATGTSLSLTGNVNSGNINATGSISTTGNVDSGNINATGSISTTGNITASYFSGNISQATGAQGNNINMGTNSAGALVSNAVTLTTTTSVTNGIALLNQILGKLVPPSPVNFPGANTLSLSGIATYRMANITQVDNTPGANKAVAAGTSVANVLRVATYTTNTIANVGPGDSGTVTAVRNGSNVGNVTLNTNANPSANGTYGGNLVISNNFDYNSANANITAGFWYVFSSRVNGSSAPPGWNELYIADSATANTNTTVWYYDNSSPSAPAFSSTTMAPPGSANLLYSSTIPHYTNNNNFTIAFTVANISGNTYPTANTLASGASGGAFAAPVTINYSGSNIGSNVLNSFASASANTTASVTTGFGGSATGPSMSVNNSYSTGTLTLTAALGNTVLWKSGTATAIDESNVIIGSTIGTGSGNAYRIVNPGTGNTPAYTSNATAFNSQSSTLQTYDATVVGTNSSGVLKHDQNNYSTGYLPAGPNLSAGRSGTQYFTFKFVRTAVSKFDVKYTGNIAGMWVALPGSVIDSSSSANGWIDMAVAYGGAGYPGVNAPGNGSDGCAVGGVVALNTSVTNNSKTCTFGTVSSSSTATNEIYVRIALTSGQTVTALTLETASN